MEMVSRRVRLLVLKERDRPGRRPKENVHRCSREQTCSSHPCQLEKLPCVDRFVSACGRWISEAIYTVPSGPFWCQRTLRQGDMVAAVAVFCVSNGIVGKVKCLSWGIGFHLSTAEERMQAALGQFNVQMQELRRQLQTSQTEAVRL